MACSRPVVSPRFVTADASGERFATVSDDEDRGASSWGAPSSSGGSEAAPAPRDEALTEVPVPGWEPAVLSIPDASEARKPVLVGTHGAGDNPVWQCEWWRRIVKDRGFVVCPRGRPLGRLPSGNMGYYYVNHFELEKEVLSALDSIAGAYPERADVTRAVYAGFSQGAIMGAPVLQRNADRFSAAVLIEGGFETHTWNVPLSDKLVKGGVLRLLFACGNRFCADRAGRAGGFLEKSGAAVRVEHAAGAGHTYGGEIERRVTEAFDWVVEGDPRWRRR
jgi:predicted esterase